MAQSLVIPPRRHNARGLIEQLLNEQQLLTPVADFARKQDRSEIGAGGGNFRKLLPMTPLKPGEQYAFEVELNKCSGCKACVTACHSLNGLDDDETWRDVGLLISRSTQRPERSQATNSPTQSRFTDRQTREIGPSALLQHVTTSCHHCVDPACLNGCPVLAYAKDPVTGIVRHLDDQCIGCQYCVLKCPYDAPKYNARLGIVRKCDLCANRLAGGEAPACAQACPNEAIRITRVSKTEVSLAFREQSATFLPGAPGGAYTLPTTRYVTSAMIERDEKNLADATPRLVSPLILGAADDTTHRPQPAHWPLVIMLVLSQASVGLTLAALFKVTPGPLLRLALTLGAASAAAGVSHLGRPLGAWRCFLGIKTSWLSREILVFGLYVPLLGVAVAGPAIGLLWLGENIRAIATVAALVGLAGVYCSVMIYHDTRRILWHARHSAGFFFGTVTIFAVAAACTTADPVGLPRTLISLTVLAKVALEISVIRHRRDYELTPLKKTALIVTGCFQSLALTRVVCAFLGGIGLPLLLHASAFGSRQAVVAWLAFTFLFAGEILERLLFFRAVDAPKMPGGLAP